MPSNYSNPNDQNKKKPLSIGEYLKIKSDTDNATLRINPDGTEEYRVGEQWFTAEDFKKLYPVPVVLSFRRKADNPDKRMNFINV